MAGDDKNDKSSLNNLYKQCNKTMAIIEECASQVRAVLMNAFKVTVSEKQQVFVFPQHEEKWNPKFHKDTITNLLVTLNKIMSHAHRTEDAINSLEIINEAACKKLADVIIDQVSGKQPINKPMSPITYAKKVTTVRNSIENNGPDHALIINTNDSATTYSEIQAKIKLREKKIRLAKAPCSSRMIRLSL